MAILVKKCKHCGSDKSDLYYEDGYHDVQCPDCGCRSGIRGDENEVLALWNGDVYQPTFYAVVCQFQYHGKLVELHEEKSDADKSCIALNKIIQSGTSIYGHKINMDFGIREFCTVVPIKLNKKYKVPEIKDG